jgi:hypothetical protein
MQECLSIGSILRVSGTVPIPLGIDLSNSSSVWAKTRVSASLQISGNFAQITLG